MRRPSYLTGEAKSFWDRNASQLIADGILNEASLDGFCLLCDVWRLIRGCNVDTGDSKEAIRYIALVKQAQSLMKQFGLLPRDRKRSGIEPEQSIHDVMNKRLNAK